jgi:hypothetical protein
MMTARIALRSLVFGWAMLVATVVSVQAADRDRLEAFLQVTGFDVALESIRLSASSAPQMLGLEANDFGAQWTLMADRVFDTDVMHGLAMDILEKTLSDDMLIHGVEFYASDLGQRLVAAENTAHMIEDDDLKRKEGADLVADMVAAGAPRVGYLKQMNAAVGSQDTSLRSIQEIQVRFLMAAAGAGVIELRMDEPDLRALMQSQEPELRISLAEGALSGAAYTYRDFTDDEILAYTDALEQPLMAQLYELMNAVQFEITANRFEALAAEMADLQPAQEL